MKTFSEEVKSGLINTEFTFPEVELYGALKGRGDFLFQESHKYIKISISSMSAVKRVYKICKVLFDYSIETNIKIDRRLKIGRIGEILLDLNYADKVFKKADINIFEDKIPESIKNDPLKLGSFLRGMFLTTGSVSLKSSYHLEFFLDITESFAEDLISTFKKLLGIKANYIYKNNKIKLYIKSSSDIISILEIMDSKESVTKLLDIIRIRELKGNVSRTINFIYANANKTAESSAKQLKDIEIIEKKIGLENLPEELQIIAKYRLDNPDESLRDLSEALNIKKSTLYSKIKKIAKIALELNLENRR
jgi:hypothetical protein